MKVYFCDSAKFVIAVLLPHLHFDIGISGYFDGDYGVGFLPSGYAVIDETVDDHSFDICDAFGVDEDVFT